MLNRILLTVFFSLFVISIYSQSSNVSVKEGEVFVIGEVSDNNYEHIYFPRNNFIVKGGGVLNYKNVVGQKVEITSIKKKNDGSLIATIKLTSKKSFFNSHKYVTVDIIEAIHDKELLRV